MVGCSDAGNGDGGDFTVEWWGYVPSGYFIWPLTYLTHPETLYSPAGTSLLSSRMSYDTGPSCVRV